MANIAILRGDQTHNCSHPYLDNLFAKYEVPIVEQRIPLLTNLHEMGYWTSLKGDEIILLDYRHWFYNDDIFESYIRQIARTKPFAVRMSNEFPEKIPLAAFEKKLHERSSVVSRIIKNESPSTTVVSIPVGPIPEKLQKIYLDYFNTKNSCFDVIAVACDFNPDERDVAIMARLATQARKFSPKPLWMVKWEVPSYEGDIPPTIMGIPVV